MQLKNTFDLKKNDQMFAIRKMYALDLGKGFEMGDILLLIIAVY